MAFPADWQVVFCQGTVSCDFVAVSVKDDHAAVYLGELVDELSPVITSQKAVLGPAALNSLLFILQEAKRRLSGRADP